MQDGIEAMSISFAERVWENPPKHEFVEVTEDSCVSLSKVFMSIWENRVHDRFNNENGDVYLYTFDVYGLRLFLWMMTYKATKTFAIDLNGLS